MEPILPIAIAFPPRGDHDLVRSLHRQLQGAIFDGRLHSGMRLPASRKLAAALGVSRNTVVASYDLLLSQGYLTGRRGSGMYVTDVFLSKPPRRQIAHAATADHRLSVAWRGATPALVTQPSASYRYDFRVGLPDKTGFPFDVWRRLSARGLRALSRPAAAYYEPEGLPALREAIAAHVSFARAVACRADDVIVTAGAQQAFDLIARILVTPGHTCVAVEDPGYPPARAAFAAAGARLIAVPVDAEGLIVERLPAEARVIVVSPSHQFPLGAAMSLRRRNELLEFARARDAVIVEDDYDGEFRFAGLPLDSLQTLDRAQSVFYLGTFSKSLFPALRLGFVVAPEWARGALIAAKQLNDWHGPLLAQETLAAFIAEGHLARHVRKMRRIYGERRAALRTAIAHHCGNHLTLFPSDTGLHVAVRLPDGVVAPQLVAAAAQDGVGVEDLNRYAFRLPAPNGLVLGIGLIPADLIDKGIETLGRSISADASVQGKRRTKTAAHRRP